MVKETEMLPLCALLRWFYDHTGPEHTSPLFLLLLYIIRCEDY